MPQDQGTTVFRPKPVRPYKQRNNANRSKALTSQPAALKREVSNFVSHQQLDLSHALRPKALRCNAPIFNANREGGQLRSSQCSQPPRVASALPGARAGQQPQLVSEPANRASAVDSWLRAGFFLERQAAEAFQASAPADQRHRQGSGMQAETLTASPIYYSWLSEGEKPRAIRVPSDEAETVPLFRPDRWMGAHYAAQLSLEDPEKAASESERGTKRIGFQRNLRGGACLPAEVIEPGFGATANFGVGLPDLSPKLLDKQPVKLKAASRSRARNLAEQDEWLPPALRQCERKSRSSMVKKCARALRHAKEPQKAQSHKRHIIQPRPQAVSKRRKIQSKHVGEGKLSEEPSISSDSAASAVSPPPARERTRSAKRKSGAVDLADPLPVWGARARRRCTSLKAACFERASLSSRPSPRSDATAAALSPRPDAAHGTEHSPPEPCARHEAAAEMHRAPQNPGSPLLAAHTFAEELSEERELRVAQAEERASPLLSCSLKAANLQSAQRPGQERPLSAAKLDAARSPPRREDTKLPPPELPLTGSEAAEAHTGPSQGPEPPDGRQIHAVQNSDAHYLPSLGDVVSAERLERGKCDCMTQWDFPPQLTMSKTNSAGEDTGGCPSSEPLQVSTLMPQDSNLATLLAQAAGMAVCSFSDAESEATQLGTSKPLALHESLHSGSDKSAESQPLLVPDQFLDGSIERGLAPGCTPAFNGERALPASETDQQRSGGSEHESVALAAVCGDVHANEELEEDLEGAVRVLPVSCDHGEDFSNRQWAVFESLLLAQVLGSHIFRIERPRRVPGGDLINHPSFKRFMHMIRNNSRAFEANGRILRLKQYMVSDANCGMMEAVISALALNTRVQALYIQNFEAGMRNQQLRQLTEVLKRGRIWALNIGENFNISLEAWQQFTDELPLTAVSYLYVSEHHLLRTDLKTQMRDAIRENRKKLPRQDEQVTSRITNMWWNPPRTHQRGKR